MTEFTINVRVYIEDTDSGGMVYYINYLKFMERARSEYLRWGGYELSSISSDGFFLVVRSANVRYRSAAKLDDELVVSARIVKRKSASVLFQQNIVRADDGLLVCEAQVDVACIDKGSGKPVAIPQRLRMALERQE
jgi:4-hydroxybenzoyl-CoA thioesterase